MGGPGGSGVGPGLRMFEGFCEEQTAWEWRGNGEHGQHGEVKWG